jgi:hypothetical protein
MMKENMLHHAKFQITDFIDGQSFYRLQWDSQVRCVQRTLEGIGRRLTRVCARVQVAETCLNMRKIWAFSPRHHQVVVKQLVRLIREPRTLCPAD